MNITLKRLSETEFQYKEYLFGFTIHNGEKNFHYTKNTPPSITRTVYSALKNIQSKPEDIVISARYKDGGFLVQQMDIYNTCTIAQSFFVHHDKSTLEKLDIHKTEDIPLIVGFVQSMPYAMVWHMLNVMEMDDDVTLEDIYFFEHIAVDEEQLEERLNKCDLEQIQTLFNMCHATYFNIHNF